mgnify:CR=1 FL=1
MVIVGFSQESSREKAREDVKQYIETAVYPVIKQQKENYISKLSDAEKAELETTRPKAPKNGNRPNGKYGGSKGKKGYPQKQRAISTESVEKITQAHPDLNEDYTELIQVYGQKWLSDIEEIHKISNVILSSDWDNNQFKSYLLIIPFGHFLRKWNLAPELFPAIPVSQR